MTCPEKSETIALKQTIDTAQSQFVSQLSDEPQLTRVRSMR